MIYETRAVLKFDVKKIPVGAKVLSAFLELYPIEETSITGNGPKTLYNVTTAWSETTATWAIPWKKAGVDYNTTPVAKSTFDSVMVWEKFDVTAVIKGAVENEATTYGFMLKFDNYKEGYGVYYHSANAPWPQLRPKLSVRISYIDTEAPLVSVTSPVSTSVWNTNTSQIITWSATDNVGVSAYVIYFSSDNGTNWTLVDSLAGAASKYTWTVPAAVSTECKVKIVVYDASGNVAADESDKFVINTGTGTVLTEKNIAEQLRLNYQAGGYILYVPLGANATIELRDLKGRQLFAVRTTSDRQWYTVPAAKVRGVNILVITEGANRRVLKTVQVR